MEVVPYDETLVAMQEELRYLSQMRLCHHCVKRDCPCVTDGAHCCILNCAFLLHSTSQSKVLTGSLKLVR